MSASKLSDLDSLFLSRALKDAKEKTDALRNRLKDEFQQADAENREPFPLTPLTGLRADLVLWACDAAAGKANADLAAVIGVQRRACESLGDAEVFLLSGQVFSLLTAAGVVEE